MSAICPVLPGYGGICNQCTGRCRRSVGSILCLADCNFFWKAGIKTHSGGPSGYSNGHHCCRCYGGKFSGASHWSRRIRSGIYDYVGYGTAAPAGVLVATIVGIALTLPISSAAICAALSLVGLAGGAAVAGCCAQMVGLAVCSYRENRVNGLSSIGLGAAMLMLPNILKKPVLWLPPLITGMITGPIATCVFRLKMNGTPISSGMGTCGLVGPIGVVTGWFSPDQAAVLINETAISPVLKDWIGLALICFVLPALLSFVISEFMRKKGWIQQGDYTLM